MDKQAFIALLKQHFPNWDATQTNLFDLYIDFLKQENQKYNLTRLDGDDKVYEKYFFASLTPFFNENLQNQSILDIGSGSGIPGIALKIIEPTIKLCILEANAKKVSFLKMLCERLNFQDVQIYQQRAELVLPELVEKFDIATSRAVASIPILVEVSAAYMKINGTLIIPKASHYETELTTANAIAQKLSLAQCATEEFIFNKISYHTIKYKKTAQTPSNYPRAWKEILKDNE